MRRLALASSLALPLSGCTFLVNDDPYKCSEDAGCASALDGGTDTGSAIACQPHRLCDTDAGTFCVEVDGAAECRPLLNEGAACFDTIPRALRSLAGSDIFLIGLVAKLPVPPATKAYGLPTTEAVEVAIPAINLIGLPAGTSLNARKLLAVKCNEDPLAQVPVGGDILKEITTHLVDQLRVPAIIGGSTSSTTDPLNSPYLGATDVLLVSPSATSDPISDVRRLDRDGMPRQLFWRTVAPDSWQVPALKAVLDQVRRNITAGNPDAGVPNVAAAYDFDNPATSGLANLFTREPKVEFKPAVSYGKADPEGNAAVNAIVSTGPNIVVPIGTGEFVYQKNDGVESSMLARVESSWMTGKDRPWYVISEGSRDGNFRLALNVQQGLGERVIGTAPGARSTSTLYAAFLNIYRNSYPGAGDPGNLAESGYDAAYLIAYAAARATNATPNRTGWPTGTDLAKAIEEFSCPRENPITLNASSLDFRRDVSNLWQSRNPDACFDFQGASGPMDFSDGPLSSGNPKSKEPRADIALWCLGNPSDPNNQTTTITKYYFQQPTGQQTTGQIVSLDNAPPFLDALRQPNWCKTASGL